MRLSILLVLVAGCTLEFVENPKPDPQPDPPPLSAAEKAWVQQALPVLQAQCVACHASTTNPSIDFMSGDTIWEQRDHLLASGVVNLDQPTASRLLTKGVHSGPAMSAQTTSDLLAWIVAERDEQH